MSPFHNTPFSDDLEPFLFHHSVFSKRAWHKNGGVSISQFSFAIIPLFRDFLRFVFGAKLAVVVVFVVFVAFSNDFVFGVSIENDAFFKFARFQITLLWTAFS